VTLWRNVPNALTILRIVLAGAFVVAPDRARLAILGAALLTELLDGMLARRFHSESRAGKLLDPIADKILFAAVAATLLIERRLSWLELLAAGSRDVIVLVGAACLAAAGRWREFLRMQPPVLGKVTTALQYLVAFLALVGGRVATAVVLLTAAVGTAAGVQSGLRFVRRPR
jgi:cardiolipin synthase (CMP-forming)